MSTWRKKPSELRKEYRHARPESLRSRFLEFRLSKSTDSHNTPDNPITPVKAKAKAKAKGKGNTSMARISVNVSDEKYQGPIDPANYRVKCTSVDLRKVSSDPTGEKQQLMWTLETYWNDKPVELTRFTPLSGKGVVFTRQLLEALQVPYDENGSGSLDFDTDDCLGRECGVTVSNGENPKNHQLQNNIDAVFRLNS